MPSRTVPDVITSQICGGCIDVWDAPGRRSEVQQRPAGTDCIHIFDQLLTCVGCDVADERGHSPMERSNTVVSRARPAAKRFAFTGRGHDSRRSESAEGSHRQAVL
jgi:hypothetical protein